VIFGRQVIRDRRPRVAHIPAETIAPNAPYLSHQQMGAGMRVAVIGTGIAGKAAAWTLSKRYPVTVYDSRIQARRTQPHRHHRL
jgi:hypothetical protein